MSSTEWTACYRSCDMLGHRWTRDPFDRIIVAHADVVSAPLLTKDQAIRRNYRRAFWD
jgi:PIN domain nuclease of toxin-antitoxin system